MRVLCKVLVIVAFGLATMQAMPAHAITPARTDTNQIEKALKAVKANAWIAALKHARQANDPLAVKIIEWLRYQEIGNQRSFEPIARFVEANPNWPRMSRLRRSAEAAIERGNLDTAISKLFAFINEVEAQSGGHITEDAANDLIAAAQALIGSLS